MHGAQGKRRTSLVSPRTLRRAVIVVAAVAFLIAVLSIKVVPGAFISPLLSTSPTARADESTGGSEVHHDVAVQPSWCPSINFFVDPDHSFAPRHVKADALREYRRQHSAASLHEKGGTNSVEVDAADIQRAEANIIRPLPPRFEEGKNDHGACKWSTSGTFLYNSFRNVLQEKALDAKPIMLDFGCSMGIAMATMHTNATVICILDDAAFYSGKGRSSGAEDPRTLRSANRPRNLLWLDATTRGVVREPFAQLYEACNFVTLGVALFTLHDPIDGSGGEGLLKGNARTISLLQRILPSTAVIIASVYVSPLRGNGDDAHQPGTFAVEPREVCKVLRGELSDVTTKFTIEYSCKVVAVVVRSPSVRLAVVRLVLLSSIRPCRKTWGAALVQWERSQTVHFSNGAVTFRVDKVSKGAASTTEKSTTLRTIHPLQYIHSLNLDTLLGAGLALPLRQQVLGQMIMSPRYSDPLPHNWVVSGGGVVERIDKIDLRYDRDVDESKGYWGHSTRGYLHLLTEHLCLEVALNGLPAIAESNTTCRSYCRQCARDCSYLPKATVPCGMCLQCGMCIQASAAPSSSGESVASGNLHCQKKYATMHAARSVWKGWERADRKHSID